MKTRAEKIAFAEAAGIRFPHPNPPAKGETIELAPGIHWAQVPLPMALNHLNIYLFEDEDGWTIVDTGMDTQDCRDAWEGLLSGPMGGRPVTRVIVTHHHPDHMGLAGWLCERFGAPLLASRTSFLTAKTLQLDAWTELPPEAVRHFRRAGYGEPEMEGARGRAKFGFGKVTYPMPVGFLRVQEGATLRLAGKNWRVHYGQGHAPDHLVLISEDEKFVLAADQVLPRITSVIGVHPLEPEADPLGEWLESCARFQDLMPDDALVMCGHNEPFTGAKRRFAQLLQHHAGEIGRVLDFIAQQPRTAIECFEVMFERKITDKVMGFATAEAVAHLNHLVATGRATRDEVDGVYWYHAV